MNEVHFLPIHWKIFLVSLSLSPQAINLHMEIKLQIWENIQEIIWVEQDRNMWLQGPREHNTHSTCMDKQDTAPSKSFHMDFKASLT